LPALLLDQQAEAGNMAIRPIDTLLAIKVINLMPGLRQSDRQVGVTLIEHFNRRTGRCDPGIKRIASLLGYCERTVIRSIQRLEAAGLFLKTRHGGYSNRNSYEPNWSRFAEHEAAWKAKLQKSASLRPAPLSPASGQSSHADGDSRVPQTYQANLQQLTCANGRPKEAGSKAHRIAGFGVAVRDGNASADAARVEAERRWSDALLRRYASTPITYGEVIELIDEATAKAATDAEMGCRGAGLASIIRKFKLEGGR
jgi:biotin operon repressor